MPLLYARAAANPAPFQIDDGLAGRARAGSYAVAVTDHVGRGADTGSWVHRGKGRVTVRASEPAWIIVDARGDAINRVIAIRRRIVNNLNQDTIR